MLPELSTFHHVSVSLESIRSQLATLWGKTDRGVHAGAADFNNTVDFDVNDVDGSAPDAVADTTSSIEILKEKSEIRKNENLKRKELNRFHHTMRIVNIMFRYSAIHKAIIIPIGLASTLIIPESAMQMISPIFAILGLHIGIKASQNLQNLIHKIRHPHMPLKSSHQHTLSKIVEKNRKADLSTTTEITGALLELMRKLPIIPRITIMAIYGICMPALLYGVTRGLLGIEHRGYELKNKGQARLENLQDKSLKAQILPKMMIGLGSTFIKVPHAFFTTVVPSLTVVAQFYTSGRTITHAVAPVSALAQKLPVIGTDSFLAWSVTSIAATTCVRTAFAIARAPVTQRALVKAYAPANRFIEKKPFLKAWKNSAEEVVQKTRKIIEKEREPNSSMSIFGKNVRRAIYTPYLLHKMGLMPRKSNPQPVVI